MIFFYFIEFGGVVKRKLIFDEPTILEFGKRLKKLRLEKGFTQETLANKANLSLSQIARIETARINPTLSTLSIIAKTLEIKLSYLVDID